jgi:hypothetical protein
MAQYAQSFRGFEQVAKLMRAGHKIYHFEAETLTLAEVTRREALEPKT